MAKKLFKNYSYTFDKNEKKLIANFCKQAVNQMMGDDRFRKDINSFNSIIDKLNNGSEEVKFTKEEKTRLVLQLKENAKAVKEKMDKSWFIKKWLYRSVYTQYNNLLLNKFEN